jgi:ionotropic glutamate receptor
MTTYASITSAPVQKDSSANLTVQEMATGVRITMLISLAFSAAVAQNVTESKAEEFHVGVVLDLGTTVGMVAHTSISIAVEDFYAVHPNHTTRLILHVKDSKSDDVQAASAGKFNPQIWNN